MPALIDLIAKVGTATDLSQKLKLLRLLPHEALLKPMVEHMLTPCLDEKRLFQLLPVFGILLQYGDDFNFSILSFVERNAAIFEKVFERVVSEKSIEVARAII